MVHKVLRRVGALLAVTLLTGYSLPAYSVTLIAAEPYWVNTLDPDFQCSENNLDAVCTPAFDDPASAAIAIANSSPRFCGPGSLNSNCIVSNVRHFENSFQWLADGTYTTSAGEVVTETILIPFFVKCPSGYQFNGFTLCFSTGDLVLAKNQCAEDSCCVGNPINPGAGGKTQIETDYAGSGAFPLQFKRAYNSQGEFSGFRIGQNWRHTYDRELRVTFINPSFGVSGGARAFRPDGRVYYFSFNGTVWSGDPDVPDRLTRLVDASGTPTGYQYTTADDTVELYNTDGKLVSIANRAGLKQALVYDASGRLDHVTDPFGRTLSFEYDGVNRIASVIDPAGGRFNYAYDASNNLITVQYPDNATKQYLYNEPALTSGANLPHALTGIIDENSSRYTSWGYDAQGRAISSERAGGAEKVTVMFNADGTGTVIDALNTSRTYGFQTQHGVARTASISQPCTSCGSIGSATTYDSNGYVASRTDFNGNVTRYTNDSRGRELSRTEAFGTAQARTITTSWHPVFRLPIQISESGRTMLFVYDATGNLIEKTAVSGTQTRAWTYTYNENGQVLTMDGPRTDVSDVTSYSYDAQGNLASIRNAASHATQITSYDAHGRPLTIVDPNGLVTRLAYDARGRMTSRDAGGAVTRYDYDPAGQLTRATLPDGAIISYSYDAAHRLVGISDGLGNRIVYTLDAMSNRVKEEIFDLAGQLAQTRSRIFDGLNRLAQEIGAAGQATTYGYDNQGNVTSIDGPLSGTVDVTANAYDALNRLIRVTDPHGGQVNYGYNALDQLTSVTDPRNLSTSYSYDGLNNLNQQVSPDTGTTTNTYDPVGNLLTRTDAKGQVTRYSYDALNRITSIAFHDGSRHTYTYDQGANEIGRLTQVADSSGTVGFSYDVNGRVIAKQQTDTTTKTTLRKSYVYNLAGQVTSMTYPSGRVLQFSYDAQGRVSAIQVDGRPILANAQYQPFGGFRGFQATAVAGQHSYTRQFDLDGRIAGYTLDASSIVVGYDAASRIVFLSDASKPANSTTYDYDALDRLTRALMPNNVEVFEYDANGNRTRQTIGSSTNIYNYAPNSNRLLQITGSQTRTYSTDANGSVTADGMNQYVYDARGRLFEADSALGKTRYLVNALGQRVAKIGPATRFHKKINRRTPVVLFFYNELGQLIGEYDRNGDPLSEFVWLGDTPVAVLESNSSGAMEILSIHTDHLNTPRLIANPLGQAVWRWDQQLPFGSNMPDDNPSGLGAFEFNLRFPGQYFDKETNLHYNYFRDYDPGIGRFVQSDPIGLRGGINPYLYVGANPLSWTDPSGLKAYQCRKPLDALTDKFGSDVADFAYKYGPYTYHQYSCVIDAKGQVTCGGQDHAGSPLRSPGTPSKDKYDPQRCEPSVDDQCFDDCLKKEWAKPRPKYGIPFGTDCQEYDNDVNSRCRKECSLK